MLELPALVRRDHDDLNYALRILCEPLSDDVHVATMLDRVQSAFPAHAEAQTLAFAAIFERVQPPPALYFLVSQVTRSHLAQEIALVELLAQRPGTPSFRERARYLRQLVVHHAEHEAACLHPALPDHLPRELYRSLAAIYTDERYRILQIPLLRNVG